MVSIGNACPHSALHGKENPCKKREKPAANPTDKEVTNNVDVQLHREERDLRGLKSLGDSRLDRPAERILGDASRKGETVEDLTRTKGDRLRGNNRQVHDVIGFVHADTFVIRGNLHRAPIVGSKGAFRFPTLVLNDFEASDFHFGFFLFFVFWFLFFLFQLPAISRQGNFSKSFGCAQVVYYVVLQAGARMVEFRSGFRRGLGRGAKC